MAKTYDPFKNVQDVMTKAMEIGHIDTTMFEIIKNPQRETKVYLPHLIFSLEILLLLRPCLTLKNGAAELLLSPESMWENLL